MTECILEDLSRHKTLRFQVNGPHATFRLRTERISAAAVRNLDVAAMDLLDVAAAVFYSDGSLSRGGNTRADMGARWNRYLRLTIPVRLPNLWQRSEVTEALSDTLRFMTGDEFEFQFVANHDRPSVDGFLNLTSNEGTHRAEHVIMFSGGLDSFAGALETLETGNGKVILVSHQSAPKVATRQLHLAQYLAERYPGRVLHIMVPANRAGVESVDSTQRSRSFLFAAMGSAIAATFDAASVSFFENGIVSHNLPVSPQIVGTMASRTTHPLVLAGLQRLISLVLPNAPKISNAFEWMTKTEVVERIRRYSAEKMMAEAVSCTRVRDQTTLHTHCGSCSQCLDRRFAILTAGLGDADPSTRYETDVIYGQRSSTAQTLPVEWTRHYLAILDMDDREFLARFGSELDRIFEAYPTMNKQDLFNRIHDLHRRQAGLVIEVLKAETARSATNLVTRSLPATCLLLLHLGKSIDGSFEQQSQARREEIDLNDPNLHELPPAPGEPLILAFGEQNGQPYVSIQGLCRFENKIAKVTTELRMQHELDKSNGLRPEEFSYLRLGYHDGLEASKGAVRVLINRGREQLARAYLDMHGQRPHLNLLFQSKHPKGYRLNPLTRTRDQQ